MTNDLISRKALAEKFKKAKNYAQSDLLKIVLSDVVDAIEEAPAIDVAPVAHGRWEKASEHMPIYVCSECKERNLFKNGDNVLSNYCPNCGAKMDKEE